MTTKKRSEGVALLFTILLTAVLLLLAIGVSNVAYRETIFSAEARDSDRAFFAADTGLECGLYWDSLGQFAGGTGGTLDCSSASVSYSGSAATELYEFVVPLGTAQCSHVIVEKLYNPVYDATTSDLVSSYTNISSYGYNIPSTLSGSTTSCYDTTTPPASIVTRALRTKYLNP